MNVLAIGKVASTLTKDFIEQLAYAALYAHLRSYMQSVVSSHAAESIESGPIYSE